MSDVHENGVIDSAKGPTLHKDIETVISFVRILENSERCTATKQMLNQEKDDFKMVVMLFGFLLALFIPSFQLSTDLKTAACVPEWFSGSGSRRHGAELILKELFCLF